MAVLKFNQVEFKLGFTKVWVYVNRQEVAGFRKKAIAHFSKYSLPSEFDQCEVVYFSFIEHENAYGLQIDLDKDRYFVKPYLEHKINKYFTNLDLIVDKNFVDGIEVWIKSEGKYNCDCYDRFSVRVIDSRNLQRIGLLISYDSTSLVTRQPVTALNEPNRVTRYIFGNRIYHVDRKPVTEPKLSFAVINNSLRKSFNIPFEGFSSKNTYREYFEKVSAFFDAFFKAKVIGNNLLFSTEGFIDVDADKVFKTKFVSNSLKFQKGNDFNVNNGIRNYGPYSVPSTENLRFIFIYPEDFRNDANKLFAAFKKGVGNFPGLYDYVKVKFELAKEYKIVLKSANHVEELRTALSKYEFEEGTRYFAIYLTDHRRIDQIEDNEDDYYQLKYLLLEKGILSQFIYHKHITQKNFNFHLPNIAVAILAKLGGIPWKLDTFTSDTLVIGFGVKKQNDTTYLGNTLCFKDDGIFFNFETYQRPGLTSIGEALRESINTVLIGANFKPSKLVIHYYKTLNEEEAKIIEKVLSSFDLNIPFVVLTINDSRSKDYLFFDVSSDVVMPVSGTIVEIKKQIEYLIANNTRHNENQLYGISKFPFPIKVKINRANKTSYDVFDNKQLLDQVYSFSRIYWKSIGQVSLPVTIAYAKIVADLAANFPQHALPKIRVAHTNLWFL